MIIIRLCGKYLTTIPLCYVVRDYHAIHIFADLLVYSLFCICLSVWVPELLLLLLLLFLIGFMYILCIWFGILCQFVLDILVGSLSTSFGRCHFCCICLSVCGCCFTVFYIVFCILKDIFIWVPIILWIFVFLLDCMWKWPIFGCYGLMSVFCFCGLDVYHFIYIMFVMMKCISYNI
jgi:hypothetical protein